MKSLLEAYAEELAKTESRLSARKEGKKPGRSSHGFEKEWSAQEIALEKAKVDTLFDEFRSVCRLAGGASREHIANIIYRNHWRGQVPDEVWAYMLGKVSDAREKNDDENEMWQCYIENRIRIFGPGDSGVWVYFKRRWDITRRSIAKRDFSDDMVEVTEENTVYYGGHRYWIGECIKARVPLPEVIVL